MSHTKYQQDPNHSIPNHTYQTRYGYLSPEQKKDKQVLLAAFIDSVLFAGHHEIITSDKWFIEKRGIPEEFYYSLRKMHLIGPQKPGKSIFVNWHTNKLFPGHTIDNYSTFLSMLED